MTNEMHISYNSFLFRSFPSAVHASSESSRSSSGAQYNILYYTVQSVQPCNTVYILCRAPDDERLDSFEAFRADRKLWNRKLIIRIVHLVGY